MSIALYLWRVLEAWDPDRHPRGPGGRFIKALGGAPSHGSLADAVHGTASLGPKRQRRGGSGGVTVADAVRDAARLSDSTGRPTHRGVGEHRAHGAPDVADEVDRALADAGVSEDVRRTVSGRARAAADSHGPRPDSLPKRVAAEVPAVPAGRHSDAVKADIRTAVAELEREPGGWIGLADLREKLGDGSSRKEVDDALHALLDEPGVRIIPVANSKALKPRDRAAAVQIGGEDNHVISIDRSVTRPAAPTPAPKMSKSGVDLSTVRGMGVFSEDPEVRAAAERYINAQAAEQDASLEKLRQAGKIGPAPTEAEALDTARMSSGTVSLEEQYGGYRKGLAEFAKAQQQAWARPPKSAEPPPVRGPRAPRTPRPGPAKKAPAAYQFQGAGTPESIAKYDAMDHDTLTGLAKQHGLISEGRSKHQLVDALADNDASRKQIVDVGRPAVEDTGRRVGPLERTEVGGWKSGSRSSGASLGTARAAAADARRELADGIVNAPSRAAARDALSGLSVRELRALAGDMGESVGSKDTKTKLIDRLVEIPGRRLDSAAFDRMARGT